MKYIILREKNKGPTKNKHMFAFSVGVVSCSHKLGTILAPWTSEGLLKGSVPFINMAAALVQLRDSRL